ncbi:MAG: ferrous iron transport protein B [Thermoplasmata archaeon]|nr:ferrous iron transport protein B [Thermoplasmata archaeon]
MKELKVAIIGNPNVGKTTLFNALTGEKQHVGNWPGVTVEKIEGYGKVDGVRVHYIDLPGVYSLSAYSIDEKIARDFILTENPDVVVDIVDATNLERNLYLTLQLLELKANVVIALNFMDEVEKRRMDIDVKKLQEFLGIKVVPVVAREGKGIEELKRAILETARHGVIRKVEVGYGRDVERAILEIEGMLADERIKCRHCPFAKLCLGSDRERHWVSTRLLEGDDEANKVVDREIALRAMELRRELEKKYGDMAAYFAKKRYELIGSIVRQCLKMEEMEETFSDRMDRVLLDKYLGIPIFFVIMWLAFKLTFDVAAPFTLLIEKLFDELGKWVAGSIPNETMASLIGEGIIGGVGSVLVFVPNIFLLFFILALLEDSGYMARAAFVMDRVMYRIGLHGKAFIPMLLGFGCNVPAIMATRTMEDERDRLLAIMINPLMSCSARLPVYVLFAGIFFAGKEAGVIMSMYLLGILLAVMMALLLRKFLFQGKPSPFIMEMPPYRLPTLRNIVSTTWNRGKMFIKKAGTIILLGVIIIWFLANFPDGGIEESFLAMIGKAMQPLFAPLGWSWRAVVALLAGVVGKEIVVGSLGALYGGNLSSALAADFTQVEAFAYMAFVLIYVPCIATIAAIWQETRSIKWPLFTITYEILLAYGVALAIVAIGGLI